MQSLILIFLLLTLSFSCTRTLPHAKAGYKSIHSHIDTMENSEDWLGSSIGGSFYDGDIKQLIVNFYVKTEEFNIEYARSLIVKGIETFLSSINENDQLIPHLNHFPFTYNDLDYGISVYTPEWKWLGYVFLVNGRLCFYEVNEFDNLDKVHEEPYPKALHKIKAGLAVPVPQFPGKRT